MKKLLIILLISIFAFTALPVLAESQWQNDLGDGYQTNQARDKTIRDAMDSIDKLNQVGISPSVTKDVIEGDPISEKVGGIILNLMGIIGSIALLIFLYGGIIWMTSEGNDQKVKKAEKTMIWAAIGLVALFMSAAVLTTVSNEFAGALFQ